MAIKRSTKFPDVKFLDSELDRIVKEANIDISAQAAKITITSVAASAASGIFVASSSGGSPTTELNFRAITLSNGTVINLLEKP